ncbi:hypothetical protein EYF80_032220 [Liparis tanakae]|uniref:Uncharacterized protein n=1 Tax=Liparis tanakae TaxID=230148 RepID=A0A4Z2GY72_9TELE|nr:hypothetical protein EYF80_032220 [Liparis tanakae]
MSIWPQRHAAYVPRQPAHSSICQALQRLDLMLGHEAGRQSISPPPLSSTSGPAGLAGCCDVGGVGSRSTNRADPSTNGSLLVPTLHGRYFTSVLEATGDVVAAAQGRQEGSPLFTCFACTCIVGTHCKEHVMDSSVLCNDIHEQL